MLILVSFVLLRNEVVPSEKMFCYIFNNAVDLIVFFMGAVQRGLLHSKITETEVQYLERQKVMQAFI